MKKLRLNVNAFDKGEVLSRAQLKKVMGGDTGSIISSKCRDQTTCRFVDGGGSSEEGYCSSYGHMEGNIAIVECYCKTRNHSTPTPIKKDSACNA